MNAHVQQTVGRSAHRACPASLSAFEFPAYTLGGITLVIDFVNNYIFYKDILTPLLLLYYHLRSFEGICRRYCDISTLAKISCFGHNVHWGFSAEVTLFTCTQWILKEIVGFFIRKLPQNYLLGNSRCDELPIGFGFSALSFLIHKNYWKWQYFPFSQKEPLKI